MKYKKGEYKIFRFGSYGEKVKSKYAVNYILAKAKVDKYLAKHPQNSAVIVHIMYNSKDNINKWDLK